jgi:hypothetical protein
VVFPAFAAPSAEFPNDNSALHEGTIWMCDELGGPLVAHAPEEPVAEAARELERDDVLAGEDENEAIEIVESIVLEGPIELVPAPLESGVVTSTASVEDEPEPRLVSTPPPPISDPFEAFLQTLSDVACDAGQTFAASEIGATLEGDAVALAWRAILNGESDDFSLCAVPLDEWAAGVLARILSAPHKTTQIRRELRVRGVAAFGLVDAA